MDEVRVKLVGIVSLVLAASACGSGQGHAGDTPTLTAKQHVELAMLKEAKAGDSQAPPKGYRYGTPVECRVDRPKAFHRSDVYLCKIAVFKMQDAFLWEWGAWYRDTLHTHVTDPKLIPTINGPFDPPW